MGDFCGDIAGLQGGEVAGLQDRVKLFSVQVFHPYFVSARQQTALAMFQHGMVEARRIGMGINNQDAHGGFPFIIVVSG